MWNPFAGKGPKPTDPERTAAAKLAALLAQHVFSGPAPGELTLTGDTPTDAVPNFRWFHSKARDVLATFLTDNPDLPPQLRALIETTHHAAAETATMLAPPVEKMEDLTDAQQSTLAPHMKSFLEHIATIGSLAQGKLWPPDPGR